MNWDKHLHTILFAYKTTFKVGTIHTPFQLVYGLHALNLLNTYYLLVNTKYLIIYFGLNFGLKCNKININIVCSFIST
jgi:hypothetical protein